MIYIHIILFIYFITGFLIKVNRYKLRQTQISNVHLTIFDNAQY